MKFNVFLTITAILVAGLIGYGFYSANAEEQFVWLLSCGSGISLGISLIGFLGISTQGKAGGANIKVLSSIFFILFLISNIVFSFTAIKVAPYIIINGILLIIYAIGTYEIIKSKQ